MTNLIAEIVELGSEIVAENCDTAAKNAPKYGDLSLMIGRLFAESPNDIHPTLCKIQDTATNATGWNQTITGLKKAVKKLSPKLVIVATRNYNETHRKANPLFVVRLLEDVESEKAAAEKAAAEKAAELEKAAAEKIAAEKAAAESKITAQDIVDAAIAKAFDLGISNHDMRIAMQLAAESYAKLEGIEDLG